MKWARSYDGVNVVVVGQRCLKWFNNNGDCAFAPHKADSHWGLGAKWRNSKVDIPVRGRVEGFASVRGKDSVVGIDKPIPHAIFIKVNKQQKSESDRALTPCCIDTRRRRRPHNLRFQLRGSPNVSQLE